MSCAQPSYANVPCRPIAADLGLSLAGIDLRRTPSGEWYCFEVDPSPAFTFYKDTTDQPIPEAVAALLAAAGDEPALAARTPVTNPKQRPTRG